MEKTLININVDNLLAHPLNPRKDLGDLTELTESIKEKGILQNLTVVPNYDMFDSYRIIIGHRRLEAAKFAGLETVPCTVVQLDEKEQVAMMLLENMQRVDLTPVEQAKGIQQCLDFGMTEDEISKQTGFSKRTVKKRLNILKLDSNEVSKVQNATIDDFIELETIKDIKERNKLLKHIGTNNFGMEVTKAKLKQDTPKVSQDVKDEVVSKDTSVIDASYELRKNFMTDVFKRKIAPTEMGAAVAVVSEQHISGKSYHDNKLYHSIVNPNKLGNDELIERMMKHRPNFFVVAVYSSLEATKELDQVYSYLREFGYVLSDEEQRMIDHD